MTRKLTLDLDSLAVETFEANAEAGPRGTVDAREDALLASGTYPCAKTNCCTPVGCVSNLC